MSEPTPGERAFAPGAGLEPAAVAHARDVLNTIASLDWPEPERVSLLARLARSARADVGTVMARLALRFAPLSSFEILIAAHGLAEKRVHGLARALARVEPSSFSAPARGVLDVWSRLDALRAENDALRLELDKALAAAKQTPAGGEPALERMRLEDVADSITRQLALASSALGSARGGLRLGAVSVELRGKAAAVRDDVALDFGVPSGGSAVGLSFSPATTGGAATTRAGSVPDVTGYTAALARRKLEQAGYGVLMAGAAGAGVVKAQSPSGGSSATVGSVVRVVLGS
jgi:PASTA domain-containing protein